MDGTTVPLEQKIYRTMDLTQDIEDMTHLLKECEGMPDVDQFQAELKKGKVGIMNLKAYMSQIDSLEFANAIKNEQQFKVCQSLSNCTNMRLIVLLRLDAIKVLVRG